MSSDTINVLIATFADDQGAGRALAVAAAGIDSGIGMAAVVVKTAEGKVRFAETHDKTAGQGALQGAGIGAIGGLIGLAFGPLALLATPIGAGVGALIGKLRDTGFDDDELKGLGDDLAPGSSALVATVESADIEQAKRLVSEVHADRVLVRELGVNLADALDQIVGDPGSGTAAGSGPSSGD